MQPISWIMENIIDATAGEVLSAGLKREFSGICIDSRKITPDELFVAIKGERYDGHAFVKEVIHAGGRGIMVQKSKIQDLPLDLFRRENAACIAVDDTIYALGALACFRRKKTNVKVAAVTGSNGKTTTKEMTAGILAKKHCVLATAGNLNNEIGLPLTLLGLNFSHQWAVLELGMNHPGEIRRLARICMPDIGVVTNIGASHLEGLGSLEAVAKAKAELLEEINPGGTAVLNADDSRVLELSRQTAATVCLYGRSKQAFVRAEAVVDHGSRASFELVLPDERIAVELPLPGAFMISNALAAASVGYLSGMTATDIKEGLEQIRPLKGRLNICSTQNGVHLIDDTYNANPYSTDAAIAALASLRKGRRSALVLGDMLELGAQARALHREIGETACRFGIKRLFLSGDYAPDVADGANHAGMINSDLFIGTKAEILHELIHWMQPGDWILIKGSRSTRMETLVQQVLNEAHDPKNE
jgi:UDP-N-acetylmuramoyl-tripeptide--D-alanyl-D-alanine ligase